MAYKKTEHYDSRSTAALAKAYRTIIAALGEDPNREGLQKPRSALQKPCNIIRRVML